MGRGAGFQCGGGGVTQLKPDVHAQRPHNTGTDFFMFMDILT